MRTITLNQFVSTSIVILILTIESAAATSDNQQDSVDWFNKGLNLDHLNKSYEAIKAYDKAIEIDPHNSLAWNNKGFALYTLSKYDEAVKAYDKAIEIDPQDSLAWNNKEMA